MRNGWKKLPKIQMVHIPQNIELPDTINASKVIIPDTYIYGSIEYEDEEGNPRDIRDATHVRFTGKDRRSDVVVGPMKPKGMIKLNVYFNEERKPVDKKNASYAKRTVLNEFYRPLD